MTRRAAQPTGTVPPATGTAPPATGAGQPAWSDAELAALHDQPDKAARVRRMFNAIAPTYELINRMFSGGRDAAWRRRAVSLADVAAGDHVLDLACGTGDMVRTFAASDTPPARIVGADFAHEMLARAALRTPPPATWCEADALALPFADRAFQVVSCAFGVRNFQDLAAGLAEMHRVLTPGGRIVILEFSQPPNRLVRMCNAFYSGRVMPAVAALISRDGQGAYRYLPKSVVSFATQATMLELLTETGFDPVQAVPLTFGVVTVYVGRKKATG